MQPELPKLFGLLPKNKVEVLPVEQYREKKRQVRSITKEHLMVHGRDKYM